nr:MAG: ORF1 [Torque teno polar bear virus 39]
MPFYRRRPYRRRRFPRRRRFIYYKHPWHRRWRRWWWRRRRNPPVRAPRPRQIRNLSITGVELLGIQGSEVSMVYTPESDTLNQGTWQINVRNMAPSNKEVEWMGKLFPLHDFVRNDCSDKFQNGVQYWDLVGGWGQANFSLESLIWRAILGFAKFSTTLERAQLVRFKGVKFTLERAPTINWLFLAEYHRSGLDWEKDLIHPVNLLCTPKTVIVNSVQRSHCCKSPRVRRKCDPTQAGWHDLEEFMKEPIVNYAWSVVNLTNPAGRNPKIHRGLDSPIQNTWLTEAAGQNLFSYCPPWARRAQYDRTFVNNMTNLNTYNDNWWEWGKTETTQTIKCAYGKYGPFMPPVIAADAPQTIWMRYQFYFQLAGRSFGFNRTAWPVREADTCSFCAPCPKGTCDACIKKGDTNKDGILKKKALKRIINAPNPRKRQLLEKLAADLRKNLRKRKRVRWLDQQQQPSKKPRATFTFSI